MEEQVIRILAECIDGGYALVYAADGCLTSVEVPLDALDVAALTTLAADIADGYVAPQEAREHGERLYAFLVRDRPWVRAVEAQLAQGDHTHIRLDIRSKGLRLVPWELVYSDGYLALMPRVRISRVVSGHRNTCSTRSPASVIVLVPDPADEMADREADLVFEALGPAQRDGLVVARQLPYSPPVLPARLGRCDILHLCGYAPERAACTDWLVAACQLAGPSLVFCSGPTGRPKAKVPTVDGVPDGESQSDSPSDVLVALQRQAGVPVVIGLCGVASGVSSSLLAAEFYRGLVGGLVTSAAAARARRQLALSLENASGPQRSLDWAGMVLYQSDDQGLVLSDPGLVPLDAAPRGSGRGDDELGRLPARMMKTGSEDPFGTYAALKPDNRRSIARKRTLGGPVEARDVDSTALRSSLAAALRDSGFQGESEAGVLDRVRVGLGVHGVESRTLELLKSALRCDDRRRQVAAVEALGLIGAGQPAARDILIGLVTGPESLAIAPIVRQMAIEQLGHVGDPQAVEALLLAMVDPDQEVRDLARSALADASQAMQHMSGRIGAKLPLQSDEATRWVTPLRQAIASAGDLSPRQRIDRMAQVEALRLELIRPRFRPDRLHILLSKLEGSSPEAKKVVFDLRRRIDWGLPGEGPLLSPNPAVPTPESRADRGGA